MQGIKINGVGVPVDVHDAGDVAVILPTNGVAMNDDQYEALAIYVAAAGTPLEKAMLIQMKAMVIGVKTAKCSREKYEKMYLEAETDLREVRLAMRKAHQLLSATNSKTTKPKLLDIVQEALDELGVLEPVEVSE